MQNITETGQTFIFQFNGVGLSDGRDGMLTIEALGDYSPTPPSSEILDMDMDGVFTDFAFDPSRGGVVENCSTLSSSFAPVGLFIALSSYGSGGRADHAMPSSA